MIKRIKRLLSCNLFKTLYINFRVLPFYQARKLPIKIGKHVDFQGIYRGCIQFKDGLEIKRYCVLLGYSATPMISPKGNYTLVRFTNKGKLILGEKIVIHNGVSLIMTNGGIISIGSDVIINQLTKIYATKLVSIGNHCRFGWECQLLDSDCHLVYNINDSTIKNPIGSIIIGDNVWVASRSTIMKGVAIPSYSIISGNSLVNKSFAGINTQGNVFAGIPAKLKATGYFRLLNGKFESKMKNKFLSSDSTSIDMSFYDFNYKNYLSRF